MFAHLALAATSPTATATNNNPMQPPKQPIGHLDPQTSRPKGLVRGAGAIVLFWLAIMLVLYLIMKQVITPAGPVVTAAGELRIERARDGHFYVPGSINGLSVTFLIDTGASMVVVDEQFARRAGLSGGIATRFATANGSMPGRVVPDATIALGPLSVSGLDVGVGLQIGGSGRALLGQNFLSRFDIALQREAMLIKSR